MIGWLPEADQRPGAEPLSVTGVLGHAADGYVLRVRLFMRPESCCRATAPAGAGRDGTEPSLSSRRLWPRHAPQWRRRATSPNRRAPTVNDVSRGVASPTRAGPKSTYVRPRAHDGRDGPAEHYVHMDRPDLDVILAEAPKSIDQPCSLVSFCIDSSAQALGLTAYCANAGRAGRPCGC